MSDWTVWWFRSDFDVQSDIPVPMSRTYPSLAEAVSAAWQAAEAGTVSWVKVFGPGGEADVRARWDAEKGDEWTDLSPTAADQIRAYESGRTTR